jgi:hypothetical protein
MHQPLTPWTAAARAQLAGAFEGFSKLNLSSARRFVSTTRCRTQPSVAGCSAFWQQGARGSHRPLSRSKAQACEALRARGTLIVRTTKPCTAVSTASTPI